MSPKPGYSQNNLVESECRIAKGLFVPSPPIYRSTCSSPYNQRQRLGECYSCSTRYRTRFRSCKGCFMYGLGKSNGPTRRGIWRPRLFNAAFFSQDAKNLPQGSRKRADQDGGNEIFHDELLICQSQSSKFGPSGNSRVIQATPSAN